MKKNSKIAVVAGLGAIAGGVAGYYLNSDKGRDQRQKAEEAIKEQSAKASTYVGDLASKAKSTASDLATKAQQTIATATEKVKSTASDMSTSRGQQSMATASNKPAHTKENKNEGAQKERENSVDGNRYSGNNF